MKRNELKQLTLTLAAAAALLTLATGCTRTATPPTPSPSVPAAATSTIKTPGAKSLTTAAATSTTQTDTAQQDDDLIKQAGFDMIYPNFNKDTGRRDPFLRVSYMEGDWEPLQKIAGEDFRVIGTSTTQSGKIALVKIAGNDKIIRIGDVLENGSVVKTISDYDVVIERGDRTMRLTMFTERRVANTAELDQAQSSAKLNLPVGDNDMFYEYLKYKFGAESEAATSDSNNDISYKEYIDQKKTGNKPYSSATSKTEDKTRQ